MITAPFTVFLRKGSPNYYVQFKNEVTGDYMPAISTRQKTKAAAMKTAWAWHSNGIPRKTNKQTVAERSLIDTAHKADITQNDVEKIITEFQRRGFIKGAILAGSKADRDFCGFLLEFWDFDRSPYVKEKLRKNHGIHRAHCLNALGVIKKYWVPAFQGRLLGSITRQDIESFVDTIGESKFSATHKNQIIKAGKQALFWAFSKGMIDTDVTAGIVLFSAKTPERYILTPEVVQTLFAHQWHDGRAKLANVVACCTGMRAGEILALRGIDLGKNCLYVRHSYNPYDGLKTTKNNESRTVQVPFPAIMDALTKLAHNNPHKQGAYGFVFYSTLPDQPIDEKVLVRRFRVALQEIGFSKESAKQYTFHGWRHFFTAYMRDQVTAKLLQSQTGHKTLTMLDHYANHETVGDAEKIQEAQWTTFGVLIPHTIEIDKQKQARDSHGRMLAWGEDA
jgi:integrase